MVLLAASLDAAAADLYGEINRLRAGAGSCASAAKLAPLAPRDALERVARDLAQGDSLERSLQSVGYGRARFSAVRINSEGSNARSAGALASQVSCRHLQDAAMTEVGIFQDPRQAWIVMAGPLSPSASIPARPAEASARMPAQVQTHVPSQSAAQRILELVNQARATSRNCGNAAFNAARPVRWNDSLAQASRLHVEDMAHNNYFSHEGRNGSTPGQRIDQTGYRWRAVGENIAAGQRSAEEAVAGWIKSPGHCANVMNPAFTEMGAAVVVDRRSNMGVYWAQEFGTPR